MYQASYIILPIWHLFPENPDGHWQTGENVTGFFTVNSTVQEPPLKQVKLAHKLLSVIKIE